MVFIYSLFIVALSFIAFFFFFLQVWIKAVLIPFSCTSLPELGFPGLVLCKRLLGVLKGLRQSFRLAGFHDIKAHLVFGYIYGFYKELSSSTSSARSFLHLQLQRFFHSLYCFQMIFRNREGHDNDTLKFLYFTFQSCFINRIQLYSFKNSNPSIFLLSIKQYIYYKMTYCFYYLLSIYHTSFCLMFHFIFLLLD